MTFGVHFFVFQECFTEEKHASEISSLLDEYYRHRARARVFGADHALADGGLLYGSGISMARNKERDSLIGSYLDLIGREHNVEFHFLSTGRGHGWPCRV